MEVNFFLSVTGWVGEGLQAAAGGVGNVCSVPTLRAYAFGSVWDGVFPCF